VDSARAAVRSDLVGLRRRDTRDTASVGRRARLELVFGCRNGRTIVKHAYAEPPYRAGHSFEDGDHGLHLILSSSAPGLFGGDRLVQEIRVETGARVRLSSQSAMQVHPSFDGQPARLEARYMVEAGGDLTCDWHPVIPFADARFEQQLRIGLEKGASVTWSDALMNGRSGSGERWAFAMLSHVLTIVRDGTLEYLERYTLTPRSGANLSDTAGEAGYFGTIVSSGRRIGPTFTDGLHEVLARFQGVHGAADTLGDALLLVRLAAASGARFHEARALVAAHLKVLRDA
jgi:urease accessory protein UreH